MKTTSRIEGALRRVMQEQPIIYYISIKIKGCCCGEHDRSVCIYKHQDLNKVKEYFEEYCELSKCKIISQGVVKWKGKRLYKSDARCVNVIWTEMSDSTIKDYDRAI